MLTPDVVATIVIGSGGGYASIAWPNGQDIRRIVAVHKSGTQFTLKVFKRQVVIAAVALAGITGNASSKCVLIFTTDRHFMKVGDSITVTGGNHAGTHVVTAVNGNQVTTATTFTAEDVGGVTAALATPTDELPLYRVMADQVSSEQGLVEHSEPSGYPFNDGDIVAGYATNKLWLHFSVAGTYRVAVVGTPV